MYEEIEDELKAGLKENYFNKTSFCFVQLIDSFQLPFDKFIFRSKKKS